MKITQAECEKANLKEFGVCNNPMSYVRYEIKTNLYM